MLKNVDCYPPDPSCLESYTNNYFNMVHGTANRPYNSFARYVLKAIWEC